MTKAIDGLYRLAAETAEDEAHALDEMKPLGLREAEAAVRDDMDAWVRDRVAAIAQRLTGHHPDVAA